MEHGDFAFAFILVQCKRTLRPPSYWCPAGFEWVRCPTDSGFTEHCCGTATTHNAHLGLITDRSARRDVEITRTTHRDVSAYWFIDLPFVLQQMGRFRLTTDSYLGGTQPKPALYPHSYSMQLSGFLVIFSVSILFSSFHFRPFLWWSVVGGSLPSHTTLHPRFWLHMSVPTYSKSVLRVHK